MPVEYIPLKFESKYVKSSAAHRHPGQLTGTLSMLSHSLSKDLFRWVSPFWKIHIPLWNDALLAEKVLQIGLFKIAILRYAQFCSFTTLYEDRRSQWVAVQPNTGQESSNKNEDRANWGWKSHGKHESWAHLYVRDSEKTTLCIVLPVCFIIFWNWRFLSK